MERRSGGWNTPPRQVSKVTQPTRQIIENFARADGTIEWRLHLEPRLQLRGGGNRVQARMKPNLMHTIVFCVGLYDNCLVVYWCNWVGDSLSFMVHLLFVKENMPESRERRQEISLAAPIDVMNVSHARHYSHFRRRLFSLALNWRRLRRSQSMKHGYAATPSSVSQTYQSPVVKTSSITSVQLAPAARFSTQQPLMVIGTSYLSATHSVVHE